MAVTSNLKPTLYLRFVFLCALILSISVLSACSGAISISDPQIGVNQPASTGQWGHQTKASGCVVNGGLPDPACTPGNVFSNATAAQICRPGYSSSVRDVPTSVKNQVFAEYGISRHSGATYEVDHLVSLELGGSNDISNLWPETASPQPGFHQKDRVENYLHEQVCSSAMSLQQAQREIAANWLMVYNQINR